MVRNSTIIISCAGEDMEDDEDFIFSNQGKNISINGHSGENKEDNEFDHIVGVLQEILLDENFEHIQKKFCNDNCMHFEATEENKLIYTDIFKKYHEIIETYITQKLTE